MSNDFGNNIISISDEFGNAYQLEHLCSLEQDGQYYMAFVPADISEDDERYGLILMKNEEDSDGESYLVNLEGEELETVYDKFMEMLFDDTDEEE